MKTPKDPSKPALTRADARLKKARAEIKALKLKVETLQNEVKALENDKLILTYSLTHQKPVSSMQPRPQDDGSVKFLGV